VYLTFPFVLSWSLLEAMALGKAIVASRTAPVEEVITDGVNGLLADFFDSEEVADRVESILADPDRRIDLRKAARATVQRDYDLKRVCLPRQIKLMDALSAGLLKGGPPCFNQ
jgi:glycosyltransferase involved in cell wall biosynthesis